MAYTLVLNWDTTAYSRTFNLKKRKKEKKKKGGGGCILLEIIINVKLIKFFFNYNCFSFLIFGLNNKKRQKTCSSS